ncbi:MAG TPA: DHA2 family efflux MFS transporter permease subunit [Steroidobacteraceae bacterium]|jgi:DHA2 family multidrug resistance protein|nr:DHA2 family efflux MFS transporter permease subunit [Steroidobacteraceae bacterium]
MNDWRPTHNPWLVAFVVTSAAFMEVLDTTIVNVALPHIAGSLSSSQDEATWTITSYLVANGIVLPISGWLSAIVGRRRFFVLCITSFTLFSVLCGLATNLPELVVFRILQGLFGGGLQPSQQAIMLDVFPPAQRARAFSIVGVAAVVGPVLGPTLGGFLTDHYSWRWIFLVNLPVGAMAAFAVTQVVEDPPWARADPARARNIDFPGLGLIALGFGSLQLVLDRGEIDDWFASPFICMFAALALICIAGAVLWLLIARHPVVDVTLFRDRNFALGCLLMFIFAGMLYGNSLLMPQLVQQRFGYTSDLAGLVLSPGSLLTAMILPFVGKAMGRVQPRYLVAFGFTAFGLGSLYTSTLSPDVGFFWLMRARIAVMMGIACLFAPISVSTTATLTPAQNSAGASLFVMARNLGGSVGISLAAASVAQRSQIHMAYLAAHLSVLEQGFTHSLAQHTQTLLGLGRTLMQASAQAQGQFYQTLIRQSSIMAYIDTFVYSGICALVVAPLALLMRARVASAAQQPGAHA